MTWTVYVYKEKALIQTKEGPYLFSLNRTCFLDLVLLWIFFLSWLGFVARMHAKKKTELLSADIVKEIYFVLHMPLNFWMIKSTASKSLKNEVAAVNKINEHI